MRRLLLVGAVLLGACGGGGESNSGPSSMTITLAGSTQFGGSESTIVRSSTGSCGMGLSGSASGYDDTGSVEVTNRDGKLLASGKIPRGTISSQTSSGQVCDFTIRLRVFEQPDDVALFTFDWSLKPWSFDTDVDKADFKDGLQLEHEFG